MNTYEQEMALEKIAQSDLKSARKEGRILIGRTKIGTVELAYHKPTRSYSIVSQDGGRKVRVHGLAACGAITRLTWIYDVQVSQ